jgi:hypothetical protein
MPLPFGKGTIPNTQYVIEFSLPKVKSIMGGETTLLLPNVEYIEKLVNGDLGIGDTILKNMIYTNLNSPIATKDSNIFKQFSDSVDFGSNTENKKNGKLGINKEDIEVPEQFNGVGLKAFEQSTLKSIFETQKPYIEVVKLILNNLINLEEITARSMPLVSSNPLLCRSKKPTVNENALGYKGGIDLVDKLSKLASLNTKGINNNSNSSNNNVGNSQIEDDKNWEILSTVYSTGQFDPNVDYTYSYINLPPLNDGIEVNEEIDKVELDPFSKFKPETIILGFFDSKGNPLNPDKKLSYTDTNGTVQQSNMSIANWVKQTDKWVFDDDDFSWPRLSEPIYDLDRNGNIKYYKENQKNILDRELDGIPGNPRIKGFEEQDKEVYNEVYKDLIGIKILNNDDLTSERKLELITEINKLINVETQLENIDNYGQIKSSVYREDLPENIRYSFKPKKIWSESARNDEKMINYMRLKGKPVSEAGWIWVDPETEYSMKVIKVNVSNNQIEGSSNLVENESVNDYLISNEPYSNGRYGFGSEEAPQTIETIERKPLSDLDTETYYIIEGKLNGSLNNGDGNEQSNEEDSGEWFYIQDAVGAIKPFISILVDITSKLIPQMNKLIELFKNPFSFITTIIDEKLRESFTFLSSENGEIIQEAVRLRDSLPDKKEFRIEFNNQVKQIKDLFKNSSLSNFIYVDDNGNFYSVIDGASTIPFNLFGKDLSFGMDLKMNKLPSSPFSLIFPGFSLDGLKDLQNSLINSNKSKNKVKDVRYDNVEDQVNTNNNTVDDSLPKQSEYNSRKLNKPESSFITFEDGSRKYFDNTRLDQFLIDNKNKFTFVYVEQRIGEKLNKIDELLEKGDEDSLNLASDLIDDVEKQNPQLGESLQGRKDELKDKSDDIKKFSQPLLKIILGIVTLPVKIVASIIEWLIDFFKKIINPLKLPGLLAEFLSFSWILNFFTPKGILEMMGIKFNPDKVAEWGGKLNVPFINDNDDLADFSEFLNVGFLLKLPTYTKGQIREIGPQQALRLLTSIFGILEQLINVIINFIWALLGIEILIKPPHIKLKPDNFVESLSPEDISKILSGDIPSSGDSYEINENGEFVKKTGETLLAFEYEINLPDGTSKVFMNRQELDEFIQENKELNYDFKF